jgi:methylphosphotriester-DNA--protein-cysteine methyltransferase
MFDKPEIAGVSATQDTRWQAVIARDRNFDGHFYYAVRTTGVYCRPSCAARLAKPENVSFYETPEEAERAGFRPCKRCKPGEPALSGQHAAKVAEICRYIEAAPEIPSLDIMARSAGFSPYYFHRLFKTVTGVTPRAFATAHRAKRVRDALAKPGTKVTDAIYGAGFNSSGRFYETSNEMLGMTPAAYRGGGENIEICFAIGECSLGAILVAKSKKGVCAILMGDDPTPSRATFKIVFRVRGYLAATKASRSWSPKWSASLKHHRSVSICRSMCAARRSSSVSGKRCGKSRQVRQRATRRSPSGSEHQSRCARWQAPARRMPSRWQSPVTVLCATMVRSPVTAGASRASAPCWIGRK